jgi:hypothetical protein
MARDKDIADRMAAALSDDKISKERKDAVATSLLENYGAATTQVGHAYLAFVLSAAAYTMLATSALSKITIVGADLGNTSSTQLLTLVMSAYFFYRAMTLAAFGSLIDLALRSYFQSELPSFAENDIEELIIPPAVFNVENAFANILQRTAFERRANDISVFTLGVVMIVGPLLWFAWAAFRATNVLHAQWWLSFPTVLVALLLLLRGIAAAAFAGKY